MDCFQLQAGQEERAVLPGRGGVVDSQEEAQPALPEATELAEPSLRSGGQHRGPDWRLEVRGEHCGTGGSALLLVNLHHARYGRIQAGMRVEREIL